MIPLRLLKEGDCRVLRTRNDSVGGLVITIEKAAGILIPQLSDTFHYNVSKSPICILPSLLKPHPTFPTMGKTL